ncbi:hypothetical protein GS399_03045 [Pedobacter sp. HMF7647]|uniref:Peptidase domain-containing ABC transporter n=1 Tax=Hufsiella arboris TaxID=2695275 RepID=A0A7K1Y5S3_9SPHI|nr:cysteine peptidase family C39 domain-containing protein [Hufsiella arboris]MXV49934.1 hypothetical protein [Hufsiella arboris]
MSLNYWKIYKSFAKQQSLNDCGPACLQSLVSYYGVAVHPLEIADLCQIRRDSGCTLFDIKQAAILLNFNTSACRLETYDLREHEPVLLHTQGSAGNHFAVCYGYSVFLKKFLIGDPAKGLLLLNDTQLQDIWVSRAALIINPCKVSIYHATAVGKWRWLLRLLGGGTALWLLSVILGLALTFTSLGIMINFQTLADKIHRAARFETYLLYMFLMAVMIAGRYWLSVTRQSILAELLNDANARLLDSFAGAFKKFTAASSHFFSRQDIVTRFHDISKLLSGLQSVFPQLLNDALLIIIFFAGLCYYSFITALVLCTGMLVAISLAVKAEWILSEKRLNVSFLYKQVENVIQFEAFQGHLNLTELNHAILNYHQLSRKFALRLEMLCGGFLFIAAANLSYECMNNTITLATLMPAFMLTLAVSATTQKIYQHILQLRDHTDALNRLYGLMGKEHG